MAWASSAWALHLQFQSGGLSHAGQSSVPEASLSAGSIRDVTQGDGLSKQQEQKHFSSCVPCVIAGRNLELLSQPVNMLQAAHPHHPLHTPQTTQRPPRPPYNCTVGSVLRSSMTVVRQTNRLLAVFPAETIWAII